MRYLWQILGWFFIINAVILGITANFNTGLVFEFLGGLIFLLYGTRYDKLRKITTKGIGRAIRYLFYFGITAITATALLLFCYGIRDNVTYEEDVLLILGGGIRGEQVTLPLQYRLDAGIEYAEKNPEALIVVSGGKGAQEDITEALAMERYLIFHGVAPERILKEERATSTYENFVYSKELLEEHLSSPYEMAVISNTFHLYRTSLLAKKVDLEITHIGTHIPFYTIPMNYLREVAAVWKTWVVGR